MSEIAITSDVSDLWTEPASAPTSGVSRIDWTADGLHVSFGYSRELPLHLVQFQSPTVSVRFPAPVPLVEILAAGRGHVLANSRLVQTSLGARLRYVSHELRADGSEIRITLATPEGIEAALVLAGQHGALQATVTLTNHSSTELLLTSVTSWVAPLGTAVDTQPVDPAQGWLLLEGTSDWLAEGRWSIGQLRGGSGLPHLRQELTGHTPRQAIVRTANGTWSTGGRLPLAGVSSADHKLAWLWQVVHNGPWRWEVGEHQDDCYVALSGPTDRDHQWSQPLPPGTSFSTVPAFVAVGSSTEDAAAALTSLRRRSRRTHRDNGLPSIVFNDYMNTLNGDPSTQRLLPLIDAAAAVGVETFCIDAGWYSNSADWWDSVGEWLPSTTRFPGGLGEVIGAIRSHGMVPGLWLEPEVVGVSSPMATQLPESAFLQRGGVRVEEQGRYHLDLRHPAARAHLDQVVDRLIADFGVGYFKFDYNIDAGTGSDRDSPSAGAALLAHNRAHLEWLEGLLERHPDLVIENCSSGAMRADAALLARVQLQSTSDQQDPLLYPPIAAAAPLLMLPEMAANWAYPQPDMTPEQAAFTLVTGLAGRFYLSGHLDHMTESQLSLVAEAVNAARELRSDVIQATPSWPLGLPDWDDRWVASALHTPHQAILSVWDRGEGIEEKALRFPMFAGRDVDVTTVFPRSLPSWETRWNAESGTLNVRSTVGAPTARTLIITPSAPPA